MKFSQLFESQNEKLNHFHEKKKLEEKSYQEYKNSMMKKHGFDSWEQAVKDKDFMDALDRGWNGGDEEGKDGLNEAQDYTSALSIYFDGKGARIDMFRPDRNSNGWKPIGTENTRSTEDTINVLKRLTSYGRVSVSTQSWSEGDKDSVNKVIAYLNTLKNIN